MQIWATLQNYDRERITMQHTLGPETIYTNMDHLFFLTAGTKLRIKEAHMRIIAHSDERVDQLMHQMLPFSSKILSHFLLYKYPILYCKMFSTDGDNR